MRAINDEPDYTKSGNYWRWLKRKFNTENIQFVSGTHKLKIVATDGKQYNSDALSAEDIMTLAKHNLTIGRASFLTGSHTAIIPLTGRVERRHILYLRADCSTPLSRAALNVCNRFMPTCLADCMSSPGR